MEQFLNKKTIIGLLVLGIVVLSIPIAVQLAQKQQILKSRASGGSNLLSEDLRNASLRVGQKTFRIESGTYQLSGTVTAGGIIQVDEYDGSDHYVTTYPIGTFTIPSGHYGYAILRAIYANATFSNVSLKKQQ